MTSLKERFNSLYNRGRITQVVKRESERERERKRKRKRKRERERERGEYYKILYSFSG